MAIEGLPEPIIELVEHPHSQDLYLARMDHAIVTGQELVENPWWYRNTETGSLYHALYGCLAWPSRVSDRDLGLPGYVAVMAIGRPKRFTKDKEYDPTDAPLILLEEAQDVNVPALLFKLLRLRSKYGFKKGREMLASWYGDPDRFTTILARYNERLITLGEPAILLTPPEEWGQDNNSFDIYVRAIKSALSSKSGISPRRLWLGRNDKIITRLREFRRDDRAVLAVGGLVHTLLSSTMWMSRAGETMFTVDDLGEHL